MSLVTRVLPPDEWRRLEGQDIASLTPYVSPEETRIIVVEEDGEIVGDRKSVV
jgi:hypothetical protein